MTSFIVFSAFRIRHSAVTIIINKIHYINVIYLKYTFAIVLMRWDGLGKPRIGKWHILNSRWNKRQYDKCFFYIFFTATHHLHSYLYIYSVSSSCSCYNNNNNWPFFSISDFRLWQEHGYFTLHQNSHTLHTTEQIENNPITICFHIFLVSLIIIKLLWCFRAIYFFRP